MSEPAEDAAQAARRAGAGAGADADAGPGAGWADTTERRTATLRSFETQAKACRALGSAFYGDVCERLHERLAASPALPEIADDFPGDPMTGWLAVRLLGGVHARVLSGEAPELARRFPSTGGDGDGCAAAEEIVASLERDATWARPWLASFPQTNEVGRAAALLPGFLEIAHATGLPLRLLEIGASAGLNLHWDRFHVDYGGRAWGDPASPVRLRCEWRDQSGDAGRGPRDAGARVAGPARDAAKPHWEARIEIARRVGCDLAPIDPRDDAAALRLQAWVWPDQTQRLANLRGAVALARDRHPGVSVERAGAAAWLARELAEPLRGVATVVFHSLMWAYVPPAERTEIVRVIESAGARASERAPLAWLALEDASPVTAVWLRRWPGASAPRALAHAHPHAAWIRWLAAARAD